MRCAIPHPCIDSSASVLSINRSSVPCNKSEVAAIFPSIFDNRMHPLLSNVKGSKERKTSSCLCLACCHPRGDLLFSLLPLFFRRLLPHMLKFVEPPQTPGCPILRAFGEGWDVQIQSLISTRQKFSGGHVNAAKNDRTPEG